MSNLNNKSNLTFVLLPVLTTFLFTYGPSLAVLGPQIQANPNLKSEVIDLFKKHLMEFSNDALALVGVPPIDPSLIQQNTMKGGKKHKKSGSKKIKRVISNEEKVLDNVLKSEKVLDNILKSEKKLLKSISKII